jgi:hypothetical protein
MPRFRNAYCSEGRCGVFNSNQPQVRRQDSLLNTTDSRAMDRDMAGAAKGDQIVLNVWSVVTSKLLMMNF